MHGPVSYITELRKIRRKGFVVNPLTLCTCGCVAEVSEEKFHNSVVIYETFYVYGSYALSNLEGGVGYDNDKCINTQIYVATSSNQAHLMICSKLTR